MKFQSKIAGVIASTAFAAIATLGVAMPAQASDVGECMTRIDAVQTDLTAIHQAGGILGGRSDQTYASLSSKLSGANVKLSQSKNADAAQKLLDFKNAVIAMRDARKAKISADDAGLLLDGRTGTDGDNGAIACVATLP